jgi:3-oxoadipate enol-lactonase
MEFTVSRSDVTLVGSDEGAGFPLFVALGSGTTVAQSAPLLAALGGARRVVTADYRGLGRSSMAPAPWAMADYAADIVALLDERGLDQIDLFGVSFGGMVALEFAVTHPERVRRLVLWCTSAGGALGSSFPLHTLAALAPDELIAARLRLLDERFTPAWLATHESDRRLVEARSTPAPGEVDITTTEGYREQMRARAGHDVADRLAALTMPVFVGAGRFDALAPPANAEALATHLAHASLHWYDGGHLFFFQDRRCWADLRDFLGDDVTPAT